MIPLGRVASVAVLWQVLVGQWGLCGSILISFKLGGILFDSNGTMTFWGLIIARKWEISGIVSIIKIKTVQGKKKLASILHVKLGGQHLPLNFEI